MQFRAAYTLEDRHERLGEQPMGILASFVALRAHT
jgi:hypothetical protein